MRSETEFQAAIALIESGVNTSMVARRLGIPRSTVRDWRHGLLVNSGGRTDSWSGGDGPAPCFRCEGLDVDEQAYAYLLGVYLGDGCLSEHPRSVYRLRIACDISYPAIINEIAARIVSVTGKDSVGFVEKEGCVEVYSYWKHWPCLFPQHAPGRKHERIIELLPWQASIVESYPKALIRGLIHSDGNRHINRITRQLVAGPKTYSYVRYMFTNASTDILTIFTDALDILGIGWTQTTSRVVSVARSGDVLLLDTFVGPKA